MSDQLFIQIDSHLHVIVRRRGKTGGDMLAGDGDTQRLPLPFKLQRPMLALTQKLRSSTNVLYSTYGVTVGSR